MDVILQDSTSGRLTSSTAISATLAAGAPKEGDVVALLVMYFEGAGDGGTISTAQDGNGKPYRQIPNSPTPYSDTAAQLHGIFRICDGTEGNVITVTFTETFSISDIWCGRFKPPSGMRFVLHEGLKGTGTGTTVNAPSLAPIANGLAVGAQVSAGSASSVNSPWTQLASTQDGNMAYYDLNVPSSQAVNVTLSSSVLWHALAMSFDVVDELQPVRRRRRGQQRDGMLNDLDIKHWFRQRARAQRFPLSCR